MDRGLNFDVPGAKPLVKVGHREILVLRMPNFHRRTSRSLWKNKKSMVLRFHRFVTEITCVSLLFQYIRWYDDATSIRIMVSSTKNPAKGISAATWIADETVERRGQALG